jgi:hypothetical protein
MTPTFKTLDFLPDRYRQATTRRRNSYFRLAVTLLFVGAFAAMVVGLESVHREVRGHAANVESRLAAAKSRAAVVKQKAAELATLDEYAGLVTFLRHPWPRSRITSGVLTKIPSSITVEKLRVYAVDRPKPPQGESSTGNDGSEPPPPSVATDLAELREQVEAFDVVVQIDGVARDLPGLHLYLQTLLADDLFVKAEPTSIEAVSRDGDPAQGASTATAGVARFTAHVTIVPGWGCQGGPAADEARGAAGTAAAPSPGAVRVLAEGLRRVSP